MEAYKIKFGENEKTIVEIDNYFLRISREGFANAIKYSLEGERVFDIKSITGYSFKKPTKKSKGYLQFVIPGSQENKDGILSAQIDINTIFVTYEQMESVEFLIKYIETIIAYKYKNNNNINMSQEIMNLHKMWEEGILTYEEFIKGKEKILN